MKLVTIRQALDLAYLGFNEPVKMVTPKPNKKQVWICPALFVPTVDEAIDWLRRKYNVVVYNTYAPFVDPNNKIKIFYSFSVKQCDFQLGWNGRILLGRGKDSHDIYAAKRNAITIAIKHLKKYARSRNKSANRPKNVRR